MIISHNFSALNTSRQLASNNKKVAKSLEKLSTGMRINRAADDAAGLAISEKMRSQISGLDQAVRNGQDGISLLQTADGGASSIHEILQRGRGLAVQASNGTLTDADRSCIQSEIDNLISQIDNIADNTEFNTIKVLKEQVGGGGPSGPSAFPGVPQSTIDELTGRLPGWINDALVAISSRLGIAYPASNYPMEVQYYYNPAAPEAASMGITGGTNLTLRVNIAKMVDGSGNLRPEGIIDTLIAHEITHALEFTEMPFSITGGGQDQENWFLEGLAMVVQGGSFFPVTDHHISLTNPFDGDYRSAYEAVKVLHEITNGGINAFIDRLEAGDTLNQAFANTTQDIAGTELAMAGGPLFTDFFNVTSFIAWYNFNGWISNYIASSNDFNLGSGAITNGGVKGSNSNLTLDQTIPNGTGTAQVNAYYTLTFPPGTTLTDNSLVLQIGANAGEYLKVQTSDLGAGALGLTGISVATQGQASSAIAAFDAAIETVSTVRGYLGAIQNRIEHTLKYLSNSKENLTAAESRIRDVDMAKEMTVFLKNEILAQAAQAMLAQANLRPQRILQLLS